MVYVDYTRNAYTGSLNLPTSQHLFAYQHLSVMVSVTATWTTQIQAPSLTPSLGSESSPSITLQPDKINSINDFIVHQAHTLPNTTLIGYPGSELGASDFVDYTARELDTFADEAAKHLARRGLVPRVIPSTSVIVRLSSLSVLASLE